MFKEKKFILWKEDLSGFQNVNSKGDQSKDLCQTYHHYDKNFPFNHSRFSHIENF